MFRKETDVRTFATGEQLSHRERQSMKKKYMKNIWTPTRETVYNCTIENLPNVTWNMNMFMTCTTTVYQR